VVNKPVLILEASEIEALYIEEQGMMAFARKVEAAIVAKLGARHVMVLVNRTR